MKVVDRVPRDLMRIKLADLQPGETTWLHRHDLHVLENGRVFIDLDERIQLRSFDSWTREPQENKFLIERLPPTAEQPMGWRMHVLGRDMLEPYGGSMDKETRSRVTPVTEIVIHDEKDEVCTRCYGLGISNLSQRTADQQNVPTSMLKQIEKALVRLEVIELARRSPVFNVNDKATVMLTPYGKELVVNDAYTTREARARAVETAEFSTELWNLMRIFGSRCGQGGPPIFEHNTVRLERR